MTRVHPETLCTLLEHAPGLVVWTDDEGVVRWVSRSLSECASEVIGRRWEELVDPGDVAEVERALGRSHEGPQTAAARIVVANGQRRHFITRTARIEGEGQLAGHVHVLREAPEVAEGAPEERQRPAALRRAQARRTDQILETMHDGYLLVGEEGVIVDVNAAYAEMMGLSREQLLGERLATFLVGGDGEAERLLRGASERLETRLRHADGHAIELEVSARTVWVDATPVTTMFLRNVSDRKRAERERRELEGQLRHKQKLESLGTLASGVAHEINNPIQGILGFAQLIQGRSIAGGEINEFAGEIIVECGRIARIVSNLLAFARRDSDAQTPSEVGHLVLTTLSLLKPTLVKDGIDVAIDLADGLPAVACRGDQIRQVVMNLLTNARDALNTRFPGPDPAKRMFIRARAFFLDSAEWVRITVEDQGVGIGPRVIERIFDPFFTTKDADSGTGLGLAVSHRIVADHGGRLLVESEPGAGSRFIVELPVSDAHELTPRPPH